MSNDQFSKLFTYMQTIKADIDAVETRLKTDINRVYNLVDADLKQREIDEQERLATNHQLDRHQRWLQELARKTDTRLSTES
ncbi:MAG TPA: hypothetical protein VLE73_02410 [Candidatus Saccharimonadales bacterium]|nr:hypothetical protein [Candidatus Saccharimonadales bacterium]